MSLVDTAAVDTFLGVDDKNDEATVLIAPTALGARMARLAIIDVARRERQLERRRGNMTDGF